MALNGTNLGDEMLTAIQALSAADQGNAQLCFREIGKAIVTHFQTNGTIVIKTTDAGLQRDNTGGNPATLGPASDKTLPGGSIQ